jgi:hypothetical protein
VELKADAYRANLKKNHFQKLLNESRNNAENSIRHNKELKTLVGVLSEQLKQSREQQSEKERIGVKPSNQREPDDKEEQTSEESVMKYVEPAFETLTEEHELSLFDVDELVQKVKLLIKRDNLSMKTIAKEIHTTQQGLWNRLNNPQPWTSLTKQHQDAYFKIGVWYADQREDEQLSKLEISTRELVKRLNLSSCRI